MSLLGSRPRTPGRRRTAELARRRFKKLTPFAGRVDIEAQLHVLAPRHTDIALRSSDNVGLAGTGWPLVLGQIDGDREHVALHSYFHILHGSASFIVA